MPVDGKAPGPSIDKLAHALLFLGVTLNACFYFLENKKHLIPVSLLIFMLPFATEYIQSHIPGRAFDTKDIIADFVGILLAIPIYQIFKKQIFKIFELLGETSK